MKQWKIILILVTTAALALAVIGVAYASYLNYANNQTSTNPSAPYATAPRESFWGWLGGCLGRRGYQPSNAYQYQTPNNTAGQIAQPYVPPANLNQGYYPYVYGRGCWG
jgi:hypothetical protein